MFIMQICIRTYNVRIYLRIYCNCSYSYIQIMHTMTERLPPYQYLIAFPQLISRICHPNSDVFTKLEVHTRLQMLHILLIDFMRLFNMQAIILKLLNHYPQQCLWMMIAVSKVRQRFVSPSTHLYVIHLLF